MYIDSSFQENCGVIPLKQAIADYIWEGVAKERSTPAQSIKFNEMIRTWRDFFEQCQSGQVLAITGADPDALVHCMDSLVLELIAINRSQLVLYLDASGLSLTAAARLLGSAAGLPSVDWQKPPEEQDWESLKEAANGLIDTQTYILSVNDCNPKALRRAVNLAFKACSATEATLLINAGDNLAATLGIKSPWRLVEDLSVEYGMSVIVASQEVAGPGVHSGSLVRLSDVELYGFSIRLPEQCCEYELLLRYDRAVGRFSPVEINDCEKRGQVIERFNIAESPDPISIFPKSHAEYGEEN
jgi:hypothetical protein